MLCACKAHHKLTNCHLSHFLHTGFNCSMPWMGPISTLQNPSKCSSQGGLVCGAGGQVFAYSRGGPLPDGWCSESWSPADCCDNLKATDTLLQVRAALGNPAFLVSWVNTSRPCASPGWEWVECDWQGRVARLNFSNMGLAGPLPQDLVVGVYGLEVLDLSYNSFSGPLPDLLYYGPDLMTSWLHNNRHLRSLDLSHNLLTGPCHCTGTR
jgi:hypothetical protein